MLCPFGALYAPRKGCQPFAVQRAGKQDGPETLSDVTEIVGCRRPVEMAKPAWSTKRK